jgi:hypothetical protein
LLFAIVTSSCGSAADPSAARIGRMKQKPDDHGLIGLIVLIFVVSLVVYLTGLQ